jgi:Tfp pilus assembly protein PilF
MEEDEPTTRMDLEAAMQAQRLLHAPPTAEQTPLVTVSGPLAQPPVRPRAGPSRHAKVGIGLFLLGVLVGVGGALAALTRRAEPARVVLAHTAAPTAPAAAALPSEPKPAAGAAKPVDATAKLVEPEPARPTPEAPQEVVARTDPPEPKLAALPISSARVPNCQQLLGEPPVKRQSTKAATRETQLANRQLLLGNVAMAQAAYCNAFALDQANVDRHVNLARLYLVRRDWEKAAELGQSGLKLAPNNRGALGVLGDAWAALNKSDKARKMMLAAEGKPSPTPKELNLIVRRNMALASRVAQKNDFLLAERLYRRVLLIEPRQVDAMSGIARCLLKAGDVRAAEAWARQAKRLKSSP